MKSVIQELNTQNFKRIRIGIGKPEEYGNLVEYVVGEIPEEHKEKLEKGTQLAKEAVIEIIKNGIDIAMNKFNIHDQDIINAILNHTTGRPGMSALEKIIYVSDYIEPGRKQAPNLKEVRKLAFQNLDAALLKILEDTLQYLKESGSETDPMTQETYDYYKNASLN